MTHPQEIAFIDRAVADLDTLIAGLRPDVATVSLTINPVNDAPVATADSYSSNEDTPLIVPAAGVLANDTDVENNPLSAVLVSGPAHGSVTLNIDGSFTYTPNANYNGVDSFTYKANDGAADSNVATVTLTINPVNDAPVATADSYSSNEDTPLIVPAAGVLANDTDVENNPLSAVLVSGPAHGSVTLNIDGSFTYTPNANYNGVDSFTYKANDGAADSNVATVTLTINPVNDAPVATADSYSSNEDTPLIVPAAGVLANDTDVEINPLSAVLVSGPAHGSVTLNIDGSFTYTPNANYNGVDSFTYKANDGAADSNVATVTLTINPVNDAPVATADSYSSNEDTPLIVPAAGVLANDTDVENNPLSAVLVSGPAHGSVTLNIDGSFTYTPNANYNGVDSFTYKANDGAADSNVATVTLTINPVNDAPVATADSYSSNEDTPLIVPAAGVLANDTDVENNPLSAVLVSGPAHGSVTLNIDGSFTYTPNANYNGVDSFTYKANDGAADSNVATVTLTINPVNDAPTIISGPTATTPENVPTTTPVYTVAATDPDSTALSYSISGGADAALFNIDSGTGAVTFKNSPNFEAPADAGGNNVYDVTVSASDGSLSASKNVAITVTDVNEAPTGFSFTPDTAHLATLESGQQGTQLLKLTSIGTFTEVGGPSGDTYTFTLGGPSASSFSMSSSSNVGTLSTGQQNLSGGQTGTLYSLTVTVNDTTPNPDLSSGPKPFDVWVGQNVDNVNLATVDGNTTTPTIAYGLQGNDIINASTLSANVWFVGGTGADTLVGGTGHNTYLYAAAAESTPSTHDTIGDLTHHFTHGSDLIDFGNITGINASGGIPMFQGNVIPSGTSGTLNAHSVGYIETGGNTEVIVNTSNTGEAVTTSSVSNANIEIVLVGTVLGLTSTDFHHV